MTSAGPVQEGEGGKRRRKQASQSGCKQEQEEATGSLPKTVALVYLLCHSPYKISLIRSGKELDYFSLSVSGQCLGC